LPKPDALKRFDANEILIRFSEELFDYPYWLQDLSHLPLFFALAWLWSWQLGAVKRIGLAWRNKALLFSLAYGCINELTQTFIPDRFPSLGDLTMNSIGATLGILAHARLSKFLESTRENAAKD
jgi:VanZ family protein